MRSSILIGLSCLIVGGCGKAGGDEKELLKNMERLSRAPVATDTFLKSYKKIECKGRAKQICTPNGCKEGPVSVTQSYDIVSGTYRRTDPKGSEEFSASTSPSGIWFNFLLSNRSILSKVNTLGDFTEVVTQNDMAIVYFGSCQFQ